MLPGNHKICLVGLSVDYTKKEILDHLQSLFPTAKLDLAMKLKKNNKNRGWATLTTEKERFKKLILEMKKFNLKGKNFFAKDFLEKDDLHKFQDDFNRRKIFVNKVPLEITTTQFRSFFEHFGELEDAFVVTTKNKKLALNYGFLIFRKREEAEELLKLEVVDFQGSEVTVERFRCRQTQEDQEMARNKTGGEVGGSEGQKPARSKRKKKKRKKKKKAPGSKLEDRARGMEEVYVLKSEANVAPGVFYPQQGGNRGTKLEGRRAGIDPQGRTGGIQPNLDRGKEYSEWYSSNIGHFRGLYNREISSLAQSYTINKHSRREFEQPQAYYQDRIPSGKPALKSGANPLLFPPMAVNLPPDSQNKKSAKADRKKKFVPFIDFYSKDPRSSTGKVVRLARREIQANQKLDNLRLNRRSPLWKTRLVKQGLREFTRYSANLDY